METATRWFVGALMITTVLLGVASFCATVASITVLPIYFVILCIYDLIVLCKAETVTFGEVAWLVCFYMLREVVCVVMFNLFATLTYGYIMLFGTCAAIIQSPKLK